MRCLPSFPITLNTFALFGIALLLGIVGGEVARRVKLPKISGYMLIGFLLGPDVFNLMNHSVLVTARLFIDISLGIILYDLGRKLDFTWLWYDRGLLLMAIAESGLTFIFIFLFLFYFVPLPWLPSALAATFAVSTSPAVVMMVAHDLDSQGPVTRRTIFLTSMNNLFALTIFTMLLPMTQMTKFKSAILWHQSGYLLFGSLILALVMFCITSINGVLIGKKPNSQFVLLVAVLVLTIGIAQLFNLPVALSLFFFGIATRNLDKKQILMELNLESTAQLFFILLFVVTGTYLHLQGLKVATATVLIFIVARSIAKTLGVWLFSNKSGITRQQMFAISLALTPMAGLAISMSNVLEDFNPDINRQISVVIAAVVAILEILGPIATQFAFIKSKETITDCIE